MYIYEKIQEILAGRMTVIELTKKIFTKANDPANVDIF